MREATCLAKLDHVNVVRYYQVRHSSSTNRTMQRCDTGAFTSSHATFGQVWKEELTAADALAEFDDSSEDEMWDSCLQRESNPHSPAPARPACTPHDRSCAAVSQQCIMRRVSLQVLADLPLGLAARARRQAVVAGRRPRQGAHERTSPQPPRRVGTSQQRCVASLHRGAGWQVLLIQMQLCERTMRQWLQAEP